MRRARVAYLQAADEARRTGDAELLGRAALGFAGGEVGFMWEIGGEAVRAPSALLREALDGLRDQAPRLRLALGWRLIYNDLFEIAPEETARLVAIGERALAELPPGSAPPILENQSRFATFAACADPVMDPIQALQDLSPALEAGGSDDEWRVRELMWAAHAAACRCEPQRCDELIERMGEAAERLGSPRFLCEVDLMRSQRIVERGDMAAGIALAESAGAVLGRLRPDLQALFLLTQRAVGVIFFDSDPRAALDPLRSIAAGRRWGLVEAWIVLVSSLAGEQEQAWARIDELLAEPDLETLATPPIHLASSLLLMAIAAARTGHRAAGERLRPLIEPLRGHVVYNAPAVAWGLVPEMAIGLLEDLAGRHESAVAELHEAVEIADAADILWVRCYARNALVRVLHRSGDVEAARRILDEGEALARGKQAHFFISEAAAIRAELDGVPLAATVPAPAEVRPVRAFAARSSRRALAVLVSGQSDEALERRFLLPRRQRSLLRAMARGFQPGLADDFEGVIAYELEPFAVEAPPDAPWRWAIQVRGGHARVLDLAPLDAAVTIHFGLADWVRVLAGVQDPITSMTEGRCRVEGDLMLAARIEPMFSAR